MKFNIALFQSFHHTLQPFSDENRDVLRKSRTASVNLGLSLENRDTWRVWDQIRINSGKGSILFAVAASTGCPELCEIYISALKNGSVLHCPGNPDYQVVLQQNNYRIYPSISRPEYKPRHLIFLHKPGKAY